LHNAGFIQLTDISGRIVLSIGAEQVSEIDLRALSSGIYTLTYTTGKKQAAEKFQLPGIGVPHQSGFFTAIVVHFGTVFVKFS